MVKGSDEYREYVDETSSGRLDRSRPERPICNSLPPGFTPFSLGGSYAETPYLTYLRSRGISDHTLRLYRMGYVDHGPLAGRVVIPSFDSFGSVNFWSARSIDPEEHRFRYRLPQASKDVISNEYMVDWSRPVYLVEGIFDEVAIGPQAISLYGKFMMPLLAKRLVERRPPSVIVCLDSDARSDARNLVKRLISYDLRCSLTDLDGKDPASVPSFEVERAVSCSRQLTNPSEMFRMDAQ